MENKMHTIEQMADAEKLLNELSKVKKDDRSFVVALVMAYLNGVEVGRMYAPDRDGCIAQT